MNEAYIRSLDEWWTDGEMVNAGHSGDESFVGDAASPDDATRIVEAHNAALAATQSPAAPKHVKQSVNGCVLCPRKWNDHTWAERNGAALTEADEARGLDVELLARAIASFVYQSDAHDFDRNMARGIAAEYARLAAHNADDPEAYRG